MENNQRSRRERFDRHRFFSILTCAILLIFIFQLIGNAPFAHAATTKFTQGTGYSKGLYDSYADQPIALNWNRNSRFAGSTVPALKWSYKTAGEITASPVTDKNGTVYIGSKDTYLYAFTQDGKLKWKYKTADSISASAVVASDGTIYVTSGMTLYAVTSLGKTKWTYKIAAESNSSLWLNSPPAIGPDGTIYVGVSGFYKNGDTTIAKGRLLAISNLGKYKWQLNTASIDSTPAIGSDGTIYITDVYYASSGNYVTLSGNVYAVASTGKQKWKYTIGSYTPSSVLIGSDGTLYVGSEDNYFYAINPTTGKAKWKVKLDNDITATAALDKTGNAYIGTSGGRFYAIDPTGKIKWEYKANGGIQSSALVDAAGVIYFGSDDNYLHALGPDGKLKWKATTLGKVVSSPAINEKRDIIVGSSDGKLYVYNPAGKAKYSFSGTVLSKQTRKPLAGATIFIAGQKITTSSMGTFTIKDIPSSQYALTISRRGYYTYVNDFYNITSNLTNRVFYLETGGALTPSPASGVAHTTVKVSGKGFPIDESGEIFIDLNLNKLRDDNETYAWVKTSINGEISPVSLVVPELKATKYEIMYTSKSIADDPNSVTPGLFTLNPLKATITSNIVVAEPHVTAKLSGSGYALGERGKLYFDKNRNGKFEWDEPYQWFQMPKGTFSNISLFIPNVTPGIYPIRYESDLGTLTVSPLMFTVNKTSAKITLNKTSGTALTKVTITGSSFVSGESGTVYFDANRNKKLDYSTDPSVYVQADSTGKFTSSPLTVPDVSIGSYYIYFQPSNDTLNVTPALFNVTATQAKMTITPIRGVPYTKINVSGSLFPADVSGYVYFDVNKNGNFEYTEPNSYLTTSSQGDFQNVSITAPSATPGVYPIRFSPSGGTLAVPSVTFTLDKPTGTLALSVTKALPHETVSLSGKGFLPYESGMVYYDINNNGKRDYDVPGEIVQYVTANSTGEFNLLDLGVPDVQTAATYKIRYESNFGPLDIPPASLWISKTPAKITAAASVSRTGTLTVSGTQFPINESGYVYIDLNNNETRDYWPNEPQGYVSTDSTGKIQVNLSIPADTPVGTYKIRFDSYSSLGELSVPPISVTIN
ncbi:outer membrane protein assembly factor BamB family protein [Neobacillus cucumis]|nr:PQQ-binding-like beta-propeller repeat protein [Neobacillus cucumis]